MHARAADWGVEVLTPAKVNSPESLQALRDSRAHLFVVAEYGQILSQRLLDIPPLGSINVHGSLLPRWRDPGIYLEHHYGPEGNRLVAHEIRSWIRGAEAGGERDR